MLHRVRDKVHPSTEHCLWVQQSQMKSRHWNNPWRKLTNQRWERFCKVSTMPMPMGEGALVSHGFTENNYPFTGSRKDNFSHSRFIEKSNLPRSQKLKFGQYLWWRSTWWRWRQIYTSFTCWPELLFTDSSQKPYSHKNTGSQQIKMLFTGSWKVKSYGSLEIAIIAILYTYRACKTLFRLIKSISLNGPITARVLLVNLPPPPLQSI